MLRLINALCLRTSYFLWDGHYYEQTEGASMGSPLPPVVANFYMEAFGKEALESAKFKPSLWVRYVDHTFVVTPHGKQKLTEFLEHLNSKHPSIKFTMELEKNSCIPFLDVMVKRKSDGTLGHSIYCKPTHTDRYLHASSHHHPRQKNSLIKTLLHRVDSLVSRE